MTGSRFFDCRLEGLLERLSGGPEVALLPEGDTPEHTQQRSGVIVIGNAFRELDDVPVAVGAGVQLGEGQGGERGRLKLLDDVDGGGQVASALVELCEGEADAVAVRAELGGDAGNDGEGHLGGHVLGHERVGGRVLPGGEHPGEQVARPRVVAGADREEPGQG